jgi:catechol 2,3-dioxygenase-like lactoylglutathione lyase family enzyme
MTGLTLLVIRCADVDQTKDFYAAVLGQKFQREQHGTGPVHFAAVLEDGTVFEIYPAGNRQPTTDMRFGFSVKSIKNTKRRLSHWRLCLDTTPDGQGFTVQDLAGNTVEIREL